MPEIHLNCRVSLLMIGLIAALVVVSHGGRAVVAQSVDVENRPIADVRVEGLELVPETLVRNAIRIEPGDPYSSEVVEEDVVRLNHLGRFLPINVEVEANDDGTVDVVYQLEELPLLADVQVLGNKAITDQELLSKVVLRSGDP
ncbi:MAG: hypothetical protein MJA84_06850, partial [Firmicutes bacterium]|nr:hypothetical protein [Bacillota bacterium]